MSKEEFKTATLESPEFSFNGTKCWARVVSVYDGDSPTIVFPFNDKMYKFSTRVYGIDTSEIKSQDQACKDRAIKARNRLVELITKAPFPQQVTSKKDIQKLLAQDVYLVWVECMEFDKYGRVLIKMQSSPQDTKNFADILIEEQCAYPYFGGTKLNETQQSTL
jgi:endonuclease YncB( thermonuclease family)